MLATTYHKGRDKSHGQHFFAQVKEPRAVLPCLGPHRSYLLILADALK